MTDNQIPRIQLSGEEARQFTLKCCECSTTKVIYFKSFGSKIFPAGAFCYKCLLKRCKATHCIPFPINVEVLDLLKQDMGITPSTPPTAFFPAGAPANLKKIIREVKK